MSIDTAEIETNGHDEGEWRDGDLESDWEPIETAIRDGTRILILRKPTSMMKYRVVIGRWKGRSWQLDGGDNRMSDNGLDGWRPLPPVPNPSPEKEERNGR